MDPSKITLGHADHIDAYWLLPEILVLVASGTNPTTGWTNWFEPLRTQNHYELKQKPPTGPAGQVILPYHIMNIFPNPPTPEVTVHEMINGVPGTVQVPVRPATLSESEMCLSLATLAGGERSFFLNGLRRSIGAGTSVRRHIGTVDIPFLCATWQNPTRARRYEVYLDVNVAGVQDVDGAITDCLRQSALAAALAYLLTPIGWAAGVGIFKGLVAACLATKLKDIIRVDIDIESHCL